MKEITNQSRLLSVPVITILILLFPSLVNAEDLGINYTLKSAITPTTFEGLLLAVLNIFVVIAIPIVVLFIIYSGFMYVTAKGNAEQIQQATRSLTYSIIGAVLIIGAVALSGIIKGTIDAFTT